MLTLTASLQRRLLGLCALLGVAFALGLLFRPAPPAGCSGSPSAPCAGGCRP
jgi:hypothetical protein